MENQDLQDVQVIPTTGRNNCGGRCIIKAHVKDGEIIKLTTSLCLYAGKEPPGKGESPAYQSGGGSPTSDHLC